MAALTQSAIDALLGVLTTAIPDEARLIGGVHSDMKFIKDEMDSMNGFLLHLNKMESEHDDQLRAWMKQVREVSYVAEDCVDRYRRVSGRYGEGWGGGGCAGTRTLAFVLKHPKAYCQLHKLGKQIAELKARVHDVGERRQRYDVNVPTGRDLKMVQNKLPDQEEEKREAFVHALEKDVVGTPGWFRSTEPAPAPALATAPASASDPAPAPASAPDPDPLDALLLEDALVGQLPSPVRPSEAAMMRALLKKCCPPDHPREANANAELDLDPCEANAKAELDLDPREAAAFRCTRKMFLCAMYVYPYPTSQELKKLKDKVVGVTEQELKELKDKGDEVGVEAPGPGVVGAQEARRQVMIFCYSILTTQQKSCLLYLTAFFHEKEISRTSMVRRWVAEGLVGKEPGGGRTTTTPEEAGERCFRELLLRGFIRAARWSDAGTVKSCVMDDPVRDFIDGITKSENFVAELPAHLDRQLNIRSIVQRRASMPPPPPPPLDWFDEGHGDTIPRPGFHGRSRAARGRQAAPTAEARRGRPCQHYHCRTSGSSNIHASCKLALLVNLGRHRRPHTTTHPTIQQGGGTGILDISSMYEMASSLALENLDIKGKMSLPSWIGRASKLANVTLRDTEMDGGDALRRLATVQSLRCLKLSRKAFTEQALRFKDVQFQALKFLVVEGDAVIRIAFFAGDAAPKLEKIVWTIGGGSKIAQMYNEDLITGIDHLPSLKEIELRASFNLANSRKPLLQRAHQI
ncbi:unnamed protein product [Miscanthus lutarioriparius]|uniref:Rx N-terminal domain-containing protein n=1 Tax=Miscanthus lutarioriparius TaxID=422564 RepID=A0A811P744_9POAL|nr:unnamed protein product [Miscanthus lutarioriparius]